MADLGPVAWPPEPIRTERLVLRAPEPRDRAALIELLASSEVNTYLGGPRPRDELERELPAVARAAARPFRSRSRRGHDRPDHSPEGGRARRPGRRRKAELGYLFLPEAWGFGYAAEACAAALGWLSGELPGEPVALFTQTANARSMRLAAKLGFTEAGRFEAWGAEQWFGLRPAAADRME